MDPIIRLHLRFHGQVQGVGFRYRAQHAANALGLTGWVENQWDDSVEMEVQGTEEAIGKMIRMINQGTFVHIAGIERKTFRWLKRNVHSGSEAIMDSQIDINIDRIKTN